MKPKCEVCQRNVVITYRSGNYGKRCTSCRPGGRNGKRYAYRSAKKDHCENPKCPLIGTVYEPYILDVDHFDGNKQNDDPSNLVTLCCVCHRRKTHDSRDYVSIKNREIK